jgi:hypothetical protein
MQQVPNLSQLHAHSYDEAYANYAINENCLSDVEKQYCNQIAQLMIGVEIEGKDADAAAYRIIAISHKIAPTNQHLTYPTVFAWEFAVRAFTKLIPNDEDLDRLLCR